MMEQYNALSGQNTQNPFPQRDALGWDMLPFQGENAEGIFRRATPYAIAQRASPLIWRLCFNWITIGHDMQCLLAKNIPHGTISILPL